MKPENVLCIGIILLLFAGFFVLAAGCAGAEKSPAPVPEQSLTATPAPVTATTLPPVAVETPGNNGHFPKKSCGELGGAVVSPGQVCPGRWLDATDTFSCCFEAPAGAATGNLSAGIQPFDFTIVFNDDPGKITG